MPFLLGFGALILFLHDNKLVTPGA